jgi:hypothetical protein
MRSLHVSHSRNALFSTSDRSAIFGGGLLDLLENARVRDLRVVRKEECLADDHREQLISFKREEKFLFGRGR